MRRTVSSFLLTSLVTLAAVPTPEAHFGHRMGDDYKLLDWAKVVSYFDALAKSSDRIRVRTLGKTTEGRPFIAAWISNPATLRQLDRYRDMQRRLADPRITTPEDAERLVAHGKTVVMITCSIHSTEVASTSAAVEFAHRILTEDRPKFRAILDNVIFILVPSLNPDGVDIVTQWYRKTLGTPHEGTSPPRLYQKYVGHDNNRDWYIFSQAETRLTIEHLHNAWHPQIVYDVHQQGASASRMFVPPWLDPIEPNVDPVIVQQMNMIGTGMAADLTAAGKKGVSINSTYDFWTPARHYQSFHGGLRILSESASAKLASPVTIKPEDLSATALGYAPRQTSWNHLEPWPGGTWRQRDIVDYQVIAWESCLWQAATRREDLLLNFYRIHERAVKRMTPVAFKIPFEQRDPAAARHLLDTLRFGQIEIDKAADGYVIRSQQPYSSWAKALLEKQKYPDLRQYPGGPPRRPYDVTAHTLPMLMGVAVREIDTIPQGLSQAPKFEFPGDPLGASNGDAWVAVNRQWAAGKSVWRNPSTGDFALSARSGWMEKKRPRIALYKSHVPSMDEGWTRWMLERFGFQYASLGNQEIIAGKLRDRFDVIVFPDQSPSVINYGYRPGSMPDELAGGLGDAGSRKLVEFGNQGGTLIFLNDSALFAAGHLGIGVRNVTRGLNSREFYCPGSLLNVSLDTSHPIALGLPRDIQIWFETSPAWNLERTPEFRGIAKFPESGILASGWLLGDKHLAGRAALVEAPMEKGRAILFGMRPQYRAQSYLTLKLLFNALLLN